MNPLVVIPTFYSSRAANRGAAPSAVYDHPATAEGGAELARCLDSLACVDGLGTVAVLVAADAGIAAQANERVRAICGRFPQVSTIVIGAAEEALIAQRLEQLNVGRHAFEIGLEGYGAVRNLALILASALGFDAVVFLDDDAVVDDAAFLEKGLYGLGKLTKRGIPILAKTGFYYNAQGSYHSMSQDKWYNRYWQQGAAFNAWIDSAMEGPRLSRSNHVCGGCLALHKEAFKRLAFDPWVVRGEDLDYLLNLRMYGSDIWFDNQWSMVHLPPASSNEGTRFRQDIYRWLYECRKIEYSRSQVGLQHITPDTLEPYPGPFLKPGIERRIRRTALLRSLGRPDKAAYRAAARAVTREAAEYAQRNCAKYFEFQFVWPQIMNRTENDPMLRSALLQSLGRATPRYSEDDREMDEFMRRAGAAGISASGSAEGR